MQDAFRAPAQHGGAARLWLLAVSALVILGAGFAFLAREFDPPASAIQPQQSPSQADVPDRGVMAAPAAAPAPLVADPTDTKPAQPIAPAASAATPSGAPAKPPPPDVIDVTVVDASGSPVEAATVTVCERLPARSPEEARAAIEARLKSMTSPVAARQAVKDSMRATMRDAMHPPIDWEHPLSTCLTDAQGSCRVQLPDAEARIFAERAGIGTSGLWTCYRSERTNLTNLAAETREYSSTVTLALQPPASLTGVVHDSRDLPVSGAIVEVTEMLDRLGLEPLVSRTPVPVVTDQEGRFALQLDAPCHPTVQAFLGDSSSLELALSLEPGQHGTITLTFPGAYSITGHVLSADRTPLPGADVSTRADGREIETSTDAEGAFVLTLAKAGEYSLKAERNGRPVLVQSRAVTAVISESVPQADTEIILLPSSRVGGKVLWSTGEPANHVLVRADIDSEGVPEADRASLPDVWWMDTTEPDGTFLIDSLHPDLPVAIWVYVPPGVETTAHGIAAGTMDVQLVLDREAAEGSTLVLDVVDTDTGAPVPSYEVQYGDWNNGLADYSAKKATVDDPRGRFIWEHARIGSQCAFVIHARGYAKLQLGPVLAAKDGAAVKARLGREGSIDVAVVDAEGAPVPRALVMQAGALSDTFDRYDEPCLEWTNASGIAHFGAAAPGRYVVQARALGQASDLVRLDVSSGGTGRTTLTLRQSWIPGDLDVLVFASDEAPIAGADVSLEYLSDFDEKGDKSRPSLEGKTDASGRRTFTGLEPGLYWVWPDLENGFIPPLQAQVYSGRSATLRFEREH
ncbi:MAG TPA: carboxypeptidase regulatory-like domain-containing protein [Planctomycetota bacterium]|nr:carboxypeptidase regulatory-like domain-containing protein [Planctomycetota bacterium]